MKECKKCNRQLSKKNTTEVCESGKGCNVDNDNSNKKRGEDRNQSFGGETHQKESKKQKTGRNKGTSWR